MSTRSGVLFTREFTASSPTVVYVQPAGDIAIVKSLLLYNNTSGPNTIIIGCAGAGQTLPHGELYRRTVGGFTDLQLATQWMVQPGEQIWLQMTVPIATGYMNVRCSGAKLLGVPSY